jgi:hypothetical protein
MHRTGLKPWLARITATVMLAVVYSSDAPAAQSSIPEVFQFVAKACRGDVNKPSEVVTPRYGFCQSRNMFVRLELTKDSAAVLGSAGFAPRARVQAESCIFPLRVTTLQSGLGAFSGVTRSIAFKGVPANSSEVFVLIVSASNGPPTASGQVAPGLLRKTLEELNVGLFKYLADGTDRPVDCRSIKL